MCNGSNAEINSQQTGEVPRIQMAGQAENKEDGNLVDVLFTDGLRAESFLRELKEVLKFFDYTKVKLARRGSFGQRSLCKVQDIKWEDK